MATKKKEDKAALILSGGGSRGAYQVGAWRALNELGIKFDMVVGVSVGALNGGMVVQDNQVLAEELWRKVESDNVFQVESGAQPVDFAKEALKQGGISSAPLQKLVNKYIPEDVVRKSPIDFGLMTIEIPAYKPHYLWKSEIPEGRLGDFIVASATIFPGVKPKVIDGVSYIDGGSINVMPIHMAVEHGATKVIAVYLKALGRFDAKTELSTCDDITLIEPQFDLGSFLIFDRENSSRLIRLGYLDAMKAFSVYDGKAYSFIKGEFDKKDLKSADDIGRIFELDPLILYSKSSFLNALSSAIDSAQEKLSDSISESKKLLKKGGINLTLNEKNIKVKFNLKDVAAELKKGISIHEATHDLKIFRDILNSANKKSTVILIASDLRANGEKSIFLNQYATNILGDVVSSARFINKYFG